MADCPGFVNIRVCVALVPNSCEPKVKLAGETWGNNIPMPLRATGCGELPALSSIMSVPVLRPGTLGLNGSEIVQLAPGASVSPIGELDVGQL